MELLARALDNARHQALEVGSSAVDLVQSEGWMCHSHFKLAWMKSSFSSSKPPL